MKHTGMTEAEARAILRRAGYDELEPWLASQRWHVSPTGWRMWGLGGCMFEIAVADAGRLRITARPAGGDRVVWYVPYRR
jgi:hypothetical protein